MKPKTKIKQRMRAQPRPDADLVFFLHDVEDPVNVGAYFRIADALRVTEVVLSGITARPPHKLISKVGRNKHERVPFRFVEDAAVELEQLKATGYTRYAVEITDAARPYFEESYATKTCLVLGHEDHGVPRRVLAHVDREVFIPMYGKGASLNVHVAGAVVAFFAAQQWVGAQNETELQNDLA